MLFLTYLILFLWMSYFNCIVLAFMEKGLKIAHAFCLVFPFRNKSLSVDLNEISPFPPPNCEHWANIAVIYLQLLANFFEVVWQWLTRKNEMHHYFVFPFTSARLQFTVFYCLFSVSPADSTYILQIISILNIVFGYLKTAFLLMPIWINKNVICINNR